MNAEFKVNMSVIEDRMGELWEFFEQWQALAEKDSKYADNGYAEMFFQSLDGLVRSSHHAMKYMAEKDGVER
jgi:hypothetical protein